MELRDYQNDMVAALFAYWQDGGGNPLVEAPTGTGKSLAIADLTRRFALQNRQVLILSHVREIIEQDAAALLALWPDMPVDMFGINSAALNRRDTESTDPTRDRPISLPQSARCRLAQSVDRR